MIYVCMTRYVKLFEDLLPKAYNCADKWIKSCLTPVLSNSDLNISLDLQTGANDHSGFPLIFVSALKLNIILLLVHLSLSDFQLVFDIFSARVGEGVRGFLSV